MKIVVNYFFNKSENKKQKAGVSSIKLGLNLQPGEAVCITEPFNTETVVE